MRIWNTRLVPATLACVLVAAIPSPGAINEPEIPVLEIIERFIDKETEFARARESYTFSQSVRVLEYNNSGRVRGRWEMEWDTLFGTQGRRIEHVTYAPPSTLKNLLLTPNDMEDLRSVQPFVMTRDNASDYRIDYLGEQQVDEIETYMFSVKPKKLEKGKRYFEGQIWVDKIGLQIVKTYGKGVGVLGKKNREQFPRFETYRDQIDGEFWFPVYTRADDTLAFDSGPQKIRMVIKYDNYKKFEGRSVITFGDVISGDQEESSEGAKP